METKMKKKRRAFVNEDDCVACGCCVKVCPRNAIEIWKGLQPKLIWTHVWDVQNV